MIEALAILIAIFGVGISAYLSGKTKGRADAEVDRAREYREQRGKLDDADLGLGATDDQRIDRLRKIANGG